jgi:ribosome-associated protein
MGASRLFTQSRGRLKRPRERSERMESEEKLELIKDACEDKKAMDLVTIDLRGKTLIADFFVLCSGNSKIHCRAIADGLLEKMRMNGFKGVRCEGYELGTWILMDYSDIVVHVFSQEEREYYNLEDLWTRAVPLDTGARNEPVYAGKAPSKLPN